MPPITQIQHLTKPRYSPFVITSYSVKDLVRLLIRNHILPNEHHIAHRWSAQKPMQLIDSLMNNYYIPPLVFTVEEDAEGKHYTSIDGHKRLEALHVFIEGIIWSQWTWFLKYSSTYSIFADSKVTDTLHRSHNYLYEAFHFFTQRQHELFETAQLPVVELWGIDMSQAAEAISHAIRKPYDYSHLLQYSSWGCCFMWHGLPKHI